jgi:hypothetical protein
MNDFLDQMVSNHWILRRDETTFSMVNAKSAVE